MNSTKDDEGKAKIRRMIRVGWIIVLSAAALHAAWVFYSSRQQDEMLRQRAIEERRARDRRAVEAMGGDRFEIQHFYASPGMIRRGEAARLCYGVSNAKAVRLEPPSGAVWPSMSRCLDVTPAKDTAYTLTIEDAQGRTKTATLVLQVR